MLEKFKELVYFELAQYEEQLDLVLSFREEIRIPVLPPLKYSFCVRISLRPQACPAALQLYLFVSIKNWSSDFFFLSLLPFFFLLLFL